MNWNVNSVIWMQEFFGPETRPIWEVITNIGGMPVLLLIVGMAFWVRETRLGLRSLIAIVVLGIVVSYLKFLALQPRPYYVFEQVQAWRAEDKFGLPSSHSAWVVLLWWMFAAVVQVRWVAIVTAPGVLLVGLSRMYFGVHSSFQVLAGWGVGLLIVIAIRQWEKPVVALFKSLGLWGQLGLAIASTLMLVGLDVTFVANRSANFEVPALWQERYHQAQVYEAGLTGVTLDEFEPLVLFNRMDLAFLGLLLGIWFVAIYVTRRGGYDGFTRREQVTNVVFGVVFICVYIPLTSFLEGSAAVGASLLAISTIILAIGVPAAGSLVQTQKRVPSK